MANHDAVIDLMNDNAQLTRTIDLLEKNAGIQAKLLADTGRQRDALVGALRMLDTLLDFGDKPLDNVWTFEDLTAIQAAFDRAKTALDQATGDPVGGEKL